MKLWSKSATAMTLFALLIYPTSSAEGNFQQSVPKDHTMSRASFQVQQNDSTTRLATVLSDHPGRATALTAKQKSEIRQILAKGKAIGTANRNIVCAGLSLAGQRESMYRVVRLRAQLVCAYAKSVDPEIKTTVTEKVITARNLNGRVQLVSNSVN